jgi:cytochrome o ubiquinol oxidase subunit II
MDFMRRFSLATLILPLLLNGCSGVLDPQGPIGVSERLVLFDSLAVMLVIVVPVIIAILGFAWWFRASNEKAFYWPEWAFSGTLELIVWAIPALVITFLGGIAWFGSHSLDPFKRIESKAKPVEIEVVSLDWKWLFIYPDEGVASLNQLALPVGSPVHFKLTSTGVMNSFFVPQLGSMIYTMAGMTSQLSLQADRPGTYHGLSAQFSGDGFSDMEFEVRALQPDAYEKWIADAKSGGSPLDTVAYTELAKQSEKLKPATYSSVDPKLFDTIVDQTAPPSQGAPGGSGGQDTPSSPRGGS